MSENRMRHRFLRRVLMIGSPIPAIVALSLGFFAVVPDASASDADQGGAAALPKTNVISTSLILDLFTWWNLEYEHSIRPDGSIGLAGSFIDFDDDEQYMSINAFYRYYPQGHALSGFFLGGRVGVYSVEDEDELDEENDTQTAFGFGIDVAYSWLLGDRQSFSISLGVGAVRLFGGDLDEATTLPTLRVLNIGFAF